MLWFEDIAYIKRYTGYFFPTGQLSLFMEEIFFDKPIKTDVKTYQYITKIAIDKWT